MSEINKLRFTPRSDANPDDFIITRKRKQYKFVVFQNMDNCFDVDNKADVTKLIKAYDYINLEIGAGTGLFSVKLAARHPERFYVALDRKSDRLVRGAKEAKRLKLTNIIFYWSNADNLSGIIPAASVDNVWITFPDPWPQESNYKHRLTHPKRLARYYRLLKNDGLIQFKTDNQPLFDWSLEQFSEDQWHLEDVTHDLHAGKPADTDNLADEFQTTTYEERYIKEARKICYLKAIKKS